MGEAHVKRKERGLAVFQAFLDENLSLHESCYGFKLKGAKARPRYRRGKAINVSTVKTICVFKTQDGRIHSFDSILNPFEDEFVECIGRKEALKRLYRAISNKRYLVTDLVPISESEVSAYR